MIESLLASRGELRRRYETALVLGCDDICSAIAHALHAAGFAVALTAPADPSWHRRGTSYVNAWYLGSAELEGIAACFCSSVRSIPAVFSQGLIGATSWSWPGLVRSLSPRIVVAGPGYATSFPGNEDIGKAIVIGAGNEFANRPGIDIVIDYPGRGGAIDGGTTTVVCAETAGRVMTTLRIGEIVRAGDIVGHVGISPIIAPISGALVGLSARGARVSLGQTLHEIDTRGIPELCFGLTASSRLMAVELIEKLAERGVQAPARTAVVS